MLLFGRTLLGGALVAGYVAVSGVAVCSASATGDAQVHYKGAGIAKSQASVSAEGLRSAIGQGVAAAAAAQVAAAPVAEFYGAGEAQAGALVQGIAHASFYGAGVAQADAYVDGVLYRRLRMPFQRPAKAYAEGSGEVVSHVLAYGRPAYARARGIGTTYHVGRGVALATATLDGDGQKMIGENQVARAEAIATGTQVYIAGAGGKGEAGAEAFGDAAVTIGGQRHFELFGVALATAKASLSHVVIYQPQTMLATAQAYGDAVQARGFSGRAVATAKAFGYMDMTYTGQEGRPASVTATATGYGVRHAFGAGVAQGSVFGSGNASAALNGAGTAFPSVTARASTVHFLLARQPSAQASAAAIGQAQRVLIAEGVTAEAGAEATGYNQVNDLVWAPLSRTALIPYAVRLSAIEAEPRTIRI